MSRCPVTMPPWLLRSVTASLAAAATSLCTGHVATLVVGSRDWTCRYFVPCAEEAAKSLYSLLFGAPLVLSHMLFGLYECLWDWHGGSSSALRAGLASLACHGAFGLITAFSARAASAVYRALGQLLHLGHARPLPESWGFLVGVAVAAGLHSLWNGLTCGRPRS